MNARISCAGIAVLLAWVAVAEGAMSNDTIKVYSTAAKGMVETQRVVKTDAEWKKELTPEQFRILREQGTERAFTGKYDHEFAKGLYTCAACGNDLFLSDAKFDSGCGWPAFYQAVGTNNVQYIVDKSHGMVRTEVRCARCGGHLGHVFNDGPPPTGLRFCINSGAVEFKREP